MRGLNWTVLGRRPARVALLVILMTALSARAGHAKDSDSLQPGTAHNETGYNRDSTYASIDGANIDAFNFNFVTQFPLAIGLSYPENAGVSLQLNLTYNSRVSYWQQMPLHRKFLRSRRQNPFGLGFDLTLGRIITTMPSGAYAYVDSSGAIHKLALVEPGSSQYRSHDGSHIRAVLASNTWTVSFQNGLVQELAHVVSGTTLPDLRDSFGNCDANDPPPPNPGQNGDTCPSPVFVSDDPAIIGTGYDREYVGWHVTKVYSRAAINASSTPSYSVEYYGDDNSSANYPYVIKNITDQFGRTIHFDLDTTRGVVDQISTPAPANEAGTARTATYLLDYQQMTVGQIPGQGRRAWYLTKLSGPDVSSSGGEQRYAHLFTYSPAGLSDHSGQLASVRYPSGVLVQISYAEYPYLNGDIGWCMPPYTVTGDYDECNLAIGGGGTCHHSWGVSQIDKYLDGNSANGAAGNHLQTKFSQTTKIRDWWSAGVAGCGGGSPPHPSGYYRFDQVNAMTDPAGNVTEFVYRTPKEHEEQNWYGLLVGQLYYGVQANGNRKLMKQIDYDYQQVDSFAFGSDTAYEMLTKQIATTWPDDTDDLGNPLPIPTRVVEDRSEFDKFGHYQRAEFSGTAVGAETKIVKKDYAADNTGPNGSECLLATALTSNWLGDVVDYEEVSRKVNGNEYTVSHVDYGYDTTRGIRTRAVQRGVNFGNATYSDCQNDPLPNGNDRVYVVTEYGYTQQGDVASERHYLAGYDALGAPTDLTTSYTYSHGARESTKQSALSYFDSFRTIDPASGLVTEEREHVTSATDTCAETTKYVYDILGRTTKVTHGTYDPVTVAYENEPEGSAWPTPVAPAVRLARVRSTQGTLLTRTESVDHFVNGRFDHEERLRPNSGRTFRYTTYNNAGRVALVSEWTGQSSAAGVPGTSMSYTVTAADGSTLFEDPFARPTSVTNPLGGVTTTRYFGLNKEVTTRGVALKASALNDPADVMVRYYTDALGRLRVVSKPIVVNPGAGPYEASGAGGNYTYDVSGRLIRVDLSDSVTVSPTSIDRYNATATSPQTRSFGYDYFGRLAQMISPEAGTVNNLAWNALGEVTKSQDAMGIAGARHHTLQTTYDGAGRPTRVQRVQILPFTSTYNAGDASWDTHGGAWRDDNPGACLQQPAGTNHRAWYVGDTSCKFAATASTGALDLDSPSTFIPYGAVLTFSYFREVRDEVGTAGNHDRFTVKVQNLDGTWTDVFFQDSSQVSWSKWVRSPAISLSAWAEHYARIRFEFDSVTQNNSSTLRGIGISQVVIKRPATVTLQETSYDEFGNNSRGKPTTIMEYDEATELPIFTRELHYDDTNARLSSENLSFDWDRDSVNQTLVDSYAYDSLGHLSKEWMPHVQGSTTRRYETAWWHGEINSITAIDEGTGAVQNIIPGIGYNDAGGTSLVSLGNGLIEHIEPNAEFLPDRIWLEGHVIGSIIWDTGQYLYDGARNIKQIGQDYYRYDADMRLTWARINTSQQGVVDLDQSYDAFGNMTSQTATQTGSYTDALPTGLAFTSRHFSSNRITDTGFAYDLNGNATSEPAHEGLLAQRYVFTPENQLARVVAGPNDPSPGMTYQSALYEGGDHRWLRSVWADGSKALFTLRDASGQVVADFVQANASSGLQLQREYVHANGQLMAINSTCGPRPALSNPSTVYGLVWFDKTDYVPAVGSYTMYITTNTGQTKSISLPLPLSDHFSVAQSQFFPNVTNWIQIETDAACGHTGYSNSVAYAYTPPTSPPSGGCLTSMTGGRFGFNGSGSSLKAFAIASCPSGTTFNIYYVDPNADATELVPLNASPVSDPSRILANMPCGSGEGNYWVRAVSPVTHHETDSSPVVEMNGTSCGGGGESSTVALPGQPSMNAQYVHWDHLGSTRVMTDENGATIAAFKYYPFGLEAESSGGDELRQKFTGHERDDRVGLDYMMARSCRMSLARFLSPDTSEAGGYADSPQSWNRYAYVSNNPLRAVDPTGKAGENPGSWPSYDRWTEKMHEVAFAAAEAIGSAIDTGKRQANKALDLVKKIATQTGGTALVIQATMAALDPEPTTHAAAIIGLMGNVAEMSATASLAATAAQVVADPNRANVTEALTTVTGALTGHVAEDATKLVVGGDTKVLEKVVGAAADQATEGAINRDRGVREQEEQVEHGPSQ